MKIFLTFLGMLLFVNAYSQINVKRDNSFLFQEDRYESLNHRTKSKVVLQNYHNEISLSKIFGDKDFLEHRFHDDLTLFIVLKEEGGNLVSLKNKQLNIKKDNIAGIDSIKISVDNKPSIITYLEAVPFGVEDSLAKREEFWFGKSHYYEILAFDKGVSRNEVNILESYLAMKFGITLKKDYLDSRNNIIWDFEDNNSYSQNVLCLGKDSRTGLNQKQSSDYENTFSFGVSKIAETNIKNNANIGDREFLFISDNGDLSVEDGDIDFIKTNRVWKVNTSNKENDTHKYSFEFDFGKILESRVVKGETIWWALNDDVSKTFDYLNATYIQADSIAESKAFFINQELNGLLDGGAFTIVKAPKFAVFVDVKQYDCGSSNVNLKILGGSSNYRYELLDQNKNIFISGLSEVNNVLLDQVPNDYYTLKITDAKGNEILKELNIIDNNLDNEENDYEFILSNSSQLILSANDYIEGGCQNFWWDFEGYYSYQDKLTINKSGVYYLKYINDKGCERELSFNIEKNGQIDGANNIVVYPNPVKSTETFTVDVNLEKVSNVDIKVYSSSGQLMFHKEYLNKDSLTFKHRLLSTGEYFVVVKTDLGSQTFKIIIE